MGVFAAGAFYVLYSFDSYIVEFECSRGTKVLCWQLNSIECTSGEMFRCLCLGDKCEQ